MQFEASRPIWLQVKADLEASIASGARPPGEKLPVGRDLALAYGINPNTAARVYQELEKDGVCETRRGMGTYVTSDPERIDGLRSALAGQAAAEFRKKVNALGVPLEEAVRIILEEE